MNLKVKFLENEYWWGGSSAHGEQQPFSAEAEYKFDMTFGLNQTMPMFISSKGR